MRTLLEALLALVAAALWPVAALAAEALAMVTDVQGRVLLAPGRAAVEILAELPADAAVELAPGARLTLVYVKGGAEYEVSGPGSARLAAAGPAVAGGAKLQAKDRLPDVYRDVKLKPARLAQASMVMRGARPGATLKLVSPVGTLVTTPSPTFRWEPVAGATAYRLQLADAAGQVVFAREVDGVSFALPADVVLRPDESYAWQVETSGPGGRRMANFSEFGVVAPTLVAQLAAARPAADAPVADRVRYAALLEAHGLVEEARGWWKALAGERIGEPSLKALAGN